MPNMDGYEATRLIKSDPRYFDVPIIGVTGNCSPADIRRGLEAGMVEVLGKPIDSVRLFNVLEKAMYITAQHPHPHYHKTPPNAGSSSQESSSSSSSTSSIAASCSAGSASSADGLATSLVGSFYHPLALRVMDAAPEV